MTNAEEPLPTEGHPYLLIALYDKMDGKLLLSHVVDMPDLPVGYPVDLTVTALNAEELAAHEANPKHLHDVATADPVGSPVGETGSAV